MTETLFEQALIFGAAFLISAATAFVLRRILIGVIDRWARKTSTAFDDIVLDALRYPSIFWAIAVAFYVALATSHFPPKYVEYGLKALYALIILSVTVAISSLVSMLVDYYVKRSSVTLPATGLLKAVARAVILTVGFLIILNGLGISITPILTALGVGGLAVALALQNTLSNLFAGMHILIERPLKVGDYIKLDSGEEGCVEDIGWRTTKIRRLQNNLVIIPNNKLSQSVITNFSLPEKRMAINIPVSVGYGSDPEKVESALLDEAKKAASEVEGMLSVPAPVVLFMPGFGEYSLIFTISCHVAGYVEQYPVQHELRKRILKRLKKEGMEIPYPVRTVYLKKEGDT